MIIVIIFVFIFFSLLKSHISKSKLRVAEEERRRSIYQKYGHTEIAEKIIDKKVWMGATGEQLIDSWGRPLDIDESVLKTKKKEVWKYCRKGANRYGYKVKIENGIVIGWDEKM